MIHVLAVITTKPGKRAEVLAAFHANIPAVHAEAGCIEYGPVIDAPNSPAKYGDDTFVVVNLIVDDVGAERHLANVTLTNERAMPVRKSGQ